MSAAPKLPARESGRIQMAKLARIRHKRAELLAEMAELDAEEARVYDELAEGESVDLRTGRRRPRAHTPSIPEASPEDSALAKAALNASALRRRIGNDSR
jgi:hypothetical protein